MMTVDELILNGQSPNHSKVPIQVADDKACVLFIHEPEKGWGWITLTDGEGRPYSGALTIHALTVNPKKGWLPASSPAEAAVCYQSVRRDGNYPKAFDDVKAWREAQ